MSAGMLTRTQLQLFHLGLESLKMSFLSPSWKMSYPTACLSSAPLPIYFSFPLSFSCTEVEFMPYNNELTVILVSQLKHPALHSPRITTDCSPWVCWDDPWLSEPLQLAHRSPIAGINHLHPKPQATHSYTFSYSDPVDNIFTQKWKFRVILH